MNKISGIALGAWAWGCGSAGGDQVFGSNIHSSDIKPVFSAAILHGLNLWDTAAVYGEGSSEAILGEILKDYDRSDVVLSTKFTPQIADKSAENPVMKMLDESLSRLGTDYVDIYWLHNSIDYEKWLPCFADVMKSGKAKKIGVSNHNLRQLKRAEEILAPYGIRISAVQNHFSLLHRDCEKNGLLSYCKENNITFFSYMVLEQGALNGKYDEKHPFPSGSGRDLFYGSSLMEIRKLTSQMKEIGKAHNADAAMIAIAWAMKKGTIPLVGVTRKEQVDEASETLRIKLSESEIQALDDTASLIKLDTTREWEECMKED